MRIGLTGGGSTLAKIVEQAKAADADGFTSLWYASTVAGDPLTAMAIAGRRDLAHRTWHGRAADLSVPPHSAGQPRQRCVRRRWDARLRARAGPLSRADDPRCLRNVLRPPRSQHRGVPHDPHRSACAANRSTSPARTGAPTPLVPTPTSAHRVPVLLSALSPRMLRLAGAIADGAVLWMASAQAIEKHVAPRLLAAAEAAGRPTPRIVAGLPVAVHDDVTEARAAVAAGLRDVRRDGELPAHHRHRRRPDPADVAIVGDEKAVGAQLRALLDAGATDIWAQPVPVGQDKGERLQSRQRTMRLLQHLLDT